MTKENFDKYVFPKGKYFNNIDELIEFIDNVLYSPHVVIDELTNNRHVEYVNKEDFYCYVKQLVVEQYYLNHYQLDYSILFRQLNNIPTVYKVTLTNKYTL